MSIKVVKTFLSYVYLEGDVEDLISVLEYLRDKRGRNTEDVNDAIRILRNFNTFYDILRRRFKNGLAPRKSERDLIAGRVVVDKIKLIKNGKRRAVVVLDKRVSRDEIISVLEELCMNYEFVDMSI